MPSTLRLYLDQAAQCASLAEQAHLPRQREMYLRAQAKWEELAEQAIDTVDLRTKREAEKAGRDS